jgi:hypothetical protein
VPKPALGEESGDGMSSGSGSDQPYRSAGEHVLRGKPSPTFEQHAGVAQNTKYPVDVVGTQARSDSGHA